MRFNDFPEKTPFSGSIHREFQAGGARNCTVAAEAIYQLGSTRCIARSR
jgi:hypothetical protein